MAPYRTTDGWIWLSANFQNQYEALCRVIDAPEPTRTARLAVVAATRQTLANALTLLGIEAPEAM